MIKIDTIKQGYKMGLAVIEKGVGEVAGFNDITDNKQYYFVVGENLIEEVHQVITEHLKQTNFKPVNTELEDVERQIASHYISCIENNLVDSLIVDNIKQSTKIFLTVCEPLQNYDC